MWSLNAQELLLCKLMSPNTDEKMLPETDDFLHFAQRNEVDALVGHFLLNSGTEQNVWKMAHQRVASYMRDYLAELDEIAARMSRDGISIVALKNGGIARGIYPCPGCCPMGDLDTLVEKRHFRRAHQVMLEMGFHFEFRSPLEEAELQAAENEGGAEYWKRLPNGEKMWFELQWRAVAGRWIRPDQEPNDEELMGRSIAIPGTDVRLLAPEDNLLQVCLHTAKHSYVRAPGFRLHLDVERIVRAYPEMDWDIFTQRVKVLQVKTPVYFSLLIPHDLFETPVPATVLDSLRPAAWKEKLIIWWLGRVGLFNPDQPKFGRLGYVIFTSLLYDDPGGLLRGIFPSPIWMMEKYSFSNKLLLPFYYLRRLLELTFHRVNT